MARVSTPLRPGIPWDARNSWRVRLLRTVAGKVAMLPDDKAGGLYALGLVVLFANSVVADQGICESDKLPGVRRVGQHFLVPGHAGVEDDLSVGLYVGPKGFAGMDGTVFQHQPGL